MEAWRETSDKSISWVWCGNLEVLFTMKLIEEGGGVKEEDMHGMRI